MTMANKQKLPGFLLLLLVGMILFAGCESEKLTFREDESIEVYRINPAQTEAFVPIDKQARETLYRLFLNREITSGTPNCSYDYVIEIGENRLGYHRECGNVTLIGRDRYFELNREECQILETACQPHLLQNTEELAEWICGRAVILRTSYSYNGNGQDKVLAGEKLKSLQNWIASLMIEKTDYPQGESPKDFFGKEIYLFDCGNGKKFEYYVEGENTGSLYFNGEWYKTAKADNHKLEQICAFDQTEEKSAQ